MTLNPKRLWDRRQVKKKTKQYSPKNIKKVLNTDLIEPKVFASGLDGQYFVPEYEDMEDIIVDNKIDKLKYYSNKFDCEQMSFMFQSLIALQYHINSVGVVLSLRSQHAFNVLIVRFKGKLRVLKYEPQDDSLWVPNAKEGLAREGYNVKDQLVLI